MNGVLARLVLRALPAPGGVRPRLAGRFDGASAPTPAPDAPQLEADVRTERSVDNPERTQPAATVPDTTTRTARSPAFASPTPHHRSEIMQVAQSGVTAVSLAGPRPLVTEALSGARPMLHEPVNNPMLHEPVNNNALLSPDVGKEPRGDDPILPPQPMPGRTPLGENSFTAEGRPAPLLPPVAPAFEPAAVLATPPHLGSRHDAAPQQPDIRISIGRIEVRAARPERRPPPGRASRPALMSLEDYLARGRTRR